MNDWIGVAIGGMIGSLGRHAIGFWCVRWFGAGFPIGTLIANFLGCFLIGIAAAAAVRFQWAGHWSESAVRVGLLGGLTTFSSYSLEITRLWQGDRPGAAMLVLVANLALGIIAVLLGMQLIPKLPAAGN